MKIQDNNTFSTDVTDSASNGIIGPCLNIIFHSLEFVVILAFFKTMPLVKLCDVSRTKRKAVVANNYSIEETITKGRLGAPPCFDVAMLITLVSWLSSC